jgi:hypothetical protein
VTASTARDSISAQHGYSEPPCFSGPGSVIPIDATVLRADCERLPTLIPRLMRRIIGRGGTAVFGHYSSAGAIPGPVVIAGVLPAPLESSRPRGWNGIVVERYRTSCVNVVAQSSAALVTVHLGPPVTMVQTRCKKATAGVSSGATLPLPRLESARDGSTGDQPISPRCGWLPALIRNAAAVAGEIHPERVELLGNFGNLGSCL